MTQRRVAALTCVVAGGLVVALAAWLVPWHPVPGGAPPPVSASDVLSAAEIARAEHFSRWARVWGWSALVVSLAVACWLGFGRRGRMIVERLPGPWWLVVGLTVLVLGVIGRLATLPLAAAGRQLRLDAGLSTQSWAGYALDLVKAELLATVVTSLGLVALLACARRLPRAWPAVAGAGAAALVLAGSFVYPLLVEPLFSSFEPLPDGELRAGIEGLADAEGVEVDQVLVADASRRTTTLNAYVSGFGDTRRVVVYDTLVEDLPTGQALSVVAHELAHARHDDVLVGSALGASGAALGVGLLGLLLGAGARRDGARAGDPTVVPRVLAMVAMASVLVLPVQNGISRLVETRADVEALAATGDPDAFVAMQTRLAERSWADPTPPAWSQWWFGSHPGVLERVALAQRSR